MGRARDGRGRRPRRGGSNAPGPALDLERMRELLAGALPECRRQLELERLELRDVRYETHRSCGVVYRLQLRARDTGSRTSQLLSARVVPRDEAPVDVPSALARRYAALPGPALRTTRVWLEDVRIVAYPFPLDPALPALVELFDPGAVRSELQRSWRARGVRPLRVVPAPLGYAPGERATVGYEVLGESCDTRIPELRRLVGRLHGSRPAAELFRNNWAIWSAASGKLPMAPPVGYLPGLQLFVQELVSGRRLSDLGEGRGLGDVVEPAARAAATLHDLEAPLVVRRTASLEAKTVHRRGTRLAELRPARKEQVRALRDRLAAELESRLRVTGVVHGDLHPDNLLAEGDRVTLVGLDEVAHGDRLLDVGRFTSALRATSLRAEDPSSGPHEAGEAFLERYLSMSGEDERRARLCEAASLLAHAGTDLQPQRSGWEDAVDLAIDEAERLLGLATRSASKGRRAGVPRKRTGKKQVAQAPRTVAAESWITDEPYVRAALDPWVRRKFDAELTACTVECLDETPSALRVRYRLEAWRGDESSPIVLDGMRPRGRSGRGAAERVAALVASLESDPDAPRLPRPVAYLPEIDLHVVEPPAGEPLCESPERRDDEAYERLGRSLRALHKHDPGIAKTRSLDVELEALHGGIERLPENANGFATTAGGLLGRIERALRETEPQTGPVLRSIAPGHVLRTAEGIAIGEVDDVVVAHPFIDAAGFLARLAALGLRQGGTGPAGSPARRFRSAYLAAEDDQDGFAAFEAAALLELACIEAGRGEDGSLAGALLQAAGARLGQRRGRLTHAAVGRRG